MSGRHDTLSAYLALLRVRAAEVAHDIATKHPAVHGPALHRDPNELGAILDKARQAAVSAGHRQS